MQVCGGKPVTVGGYAYLDGELHVRVNLACDAIMNSIISNYGAKNTRLAVLNLLALLALLVQTYKY